MYIDPGAGGLIIQAVIGAIVAIPMFFAMFGRRIKNVFKRK
jgi:hypothetical protein